MKQEREVYVADFETRAGEQAEKEGVTWVWAWAICNINDIEHVTTGSTIREFMVYLKGLKDCIIYFHNFKFDGKFILDYLLKNDYIWCENRKQYNTFNNGFTTLIDNNGAFYTLKIHNGYRKNIEFRDSQKKIPLSVEKMAKDYNTKYQKLTIDYVVDRPEGYIMTRQEQEYVSNDVRVVAEVLALYYSEGYTHMTIGSDAIAYLKENFDGQKNDDSVALFEKRFPKLSKLEDSFIRHAYKGGWCYVAPWCKGKLLENIEGISFDVNSLYPSMLSSTKYTLDGTTYINKYPCGHGVFYEGKYKQDDDMPLYVQHIICTFHIKKNYLPTIQLKHSSMFMPHEYIENCDDLTELWLTSVDLELFLKHYDVDFIKYIDGYKYAARVGMFDDYLYHFMAQKMTAQGGKRKIAKNFLNNIYGKFAQSIETVSKKPVLNTELEKVQYETLPITEREPLYIPVGAFCTAYARRFTITTAQLNYHPLEKRGFCYSDTDSIYMTGEYKGFNIDDVKMCCWKIEHNFTSAKFLRQKTYVIYDNEWIVKCAGMPENVKQAFLSDVNTGKKKINDFDYGLHYDNLKLRPCTVKGGVLLKTTPFEIKGLTKKDEKEVEKIVKNMKY